MANGSPYKQRSSSRMGGQALHPLDWERATVQHVLSRELWEQIEDFATEQMMSVGKVCRRVVRDWAQNRLDNKKAKEIGKQ